MIKEIDELQCINCGLCEDVCPTDVLRCRDGKVEIAYPGDCCNCMECLFICPTDAIILVPGTPEKFNATLRWNQIKKALSNSG
jgi:NAD-dependent dihydropyrimidine dehydrogenase PreA subunit